MHTSVLVSEYEIVDLVTLLIMYLDQKIEVVSKTELTVNSKLVNVAPLLVDAGYTMCVDPDVHTITITGKVADKVTDKVTVKV